jgi:hypothetical protein
MTKRYTPQAPGLAYQDEEGDFVHYLDYKTLVDAAREAVIDLDLKYEKSAKLHLEKALTSVGEEI